jgi:hypothetical protein
MEGVGVCHNNFRDLVIHSVLHKLVGAQGHAASPHRDACQRERDFLLKLRGPILGLPRAPVGGGHNFLILSKSLGHLHSPPPGKTNKNEHSLITI